MPLKLLIILLFLFSAFITTANAQNGKTVLTIDDVDRTPPIKIESNPRARSAGGAAGAVNGGAAAPSGGTAVRRPVPPSPEPGPTEPPIKIIVLEKNRRCAVHRKPRFYEFPLSPVF